MPHAMERTNLEPGAHLRRGQDGTMRGVALCTEDKGKRVHHIGVPIYYAQTVCMGNIGMLLLRCVIEAR